MSQTVRNVQHDAGRLRTIARLALKVAGVAQVNEGAGQEVDEERR